MLHDVQARLRDEQERGGIRDGYHVRRCGELCSEMRMHDHGHHDDHVVVSQQLWQEQRLI